MQQSSLAFLGCGSVRINSPGVSEVTKNELSDIVWPPV